MTLLASFDWATIWDNRGDLAEGLWRTIQVSAIGIAGATAIGIVLGAVRAHRIPVLTQLAAAYVEVVRNTPILAQIFLLFYGLPFLSPHLRFTGFTTAWLAVTIWGGAFNTENSSTINTYVSVLKNTSLMTAIGFQELTGTSRSISASNFRDVEMLSTVAVVYLVLVWSLSGGVRLLERRLAFEELR